MFPSSRLGRSALCGQCRPKFWSLHSTQATTMPPSQLKRLKASLRENRITGPQKSKKAKKQQKNGGADLRIQKQNALANLREEFNPFEVKASSRPRKFAVTTSRPAENGILGRPGVSKSVGEEVVRMQFYLNFERRLIDYSCRDGRPYCLKSTGGISQEA